MKPPQGRLPRTSPRLSAAAVAGRVMARQRPDGDAPWVSGSLGLGEWFLPKEPFKFHGNPGWRIIAMILKINLNTYSHNLYYTGLGVLVFSILLKHSRIINHQCYLFCMTTFCPEQTLESIIATSPSSSLKPLALRGPCSDSMLFFWGIAGQAHVLFGDVTHFFAAGQESTWHIVSLDMWA